MGFKKIRPRKKVCYFTKKSDCSFNLNLIGCLLYEAERRINGSVRYSIVPDMIDFKDTKKLERRNKI